MKHDKYHYINLPSIKEHGFSWVCFEDGLHIFQKPVTHTPKLSQAMLDDGYKPVPERRYVVVRCTEEDITDGNMAFFMTRGYTR